MNCTRLKQRLIAQFPDVSQFQGRYMLLLVFDEDVDYACEENWDIVMLLLFNELNRLYTITSSHIQNCMAHL